ncbi:TetR family transcriptional regulator [Azospirillum sp. TSO35-2]|uniref:TetR family transcriptional regulator n=1 Tax=Azospirillum sp. TSO35-2 TaxID=716796 RepID=UPI000D6184CD|nr:TetR family transcriptional regulator [Azospirillum sp. TSO35-2]PWC31335.1 TetR family transcriptional regulator [Azospirillum sp. TSO35-2]
MSDRSHPCISSRKQPKQDRSTRLVETILEAAIQVLAKEGAQRFTTARVAERAGVSVGSLYQYFPNKAAILFRLQSDEWTRTATMMEGILRDPGQPPLDRMRPLVHAFIRSECEEAAVRVALNDAAPLYRDSPEAQETRAAGKRLIDDYMRDTLPGAPDAVRDMAGTLITSTLSAAGKQFSGTPRTAADIQAYADAMADMFCAYLRDLSRKGAGGDDRLR